MATTKTKHLSSNQKKQNKDKDQKQKPPPKKQLGRSTRLNSLAFYKNQSAD